MPSANHTTAAITALDAAFEMEDELIKVKSVSRSLMQLGTYRDVVIDEDDRLMFLTLTRMLDDAIGAAEQLRIRIIDATHGAKYPRPVAA